MNLPRTKEVTHDHRKLYPQVYGAKQGPVTIEQMPPLVYVSQQMNTSFRMNWAGHPQPLDEQWIAWKVVNQLKRITKKSLGYKFKLMPHEVVWHEELEAGKWSVTKMMQVPDFITFEMFEQARAHVEKNLPGQHIPSTKLVRAPSGPFAHKLHVGHYRHTQQTMQEICTYVHENGYVVKGDRREIYLTPAMDCHPPDTWKTIVRVEIEQAI
ncbi:GyrI-like domain-containing protein [Paenibacillus allorhizosphaerae]|uniref:GyrI-like small molecule binding domain-containing protein n=1 Tax=Paenibacillus allorhizosphaerae TaxID=2849866 RepID=A0ABN7TLZ7_9BACL|nr:GyrI-like domain-containing protein [Paenibacillus allorhizosphaerae]CAG7633879.1 hypothetical protein PAECIP111802_01991 [Paenibacillus allorhizosphaerae]